MNLHAIQEAARAYLHDIRNALSPVIMEDAADPLLTPQERADCLRRAKAACERFDRESAALLGEVANG